MTKDISEPQKLWMPTKQTLMDMKEAMGRLQSSDEEFKRAFEILEKYPRRITMFGSARTPESDKYYKLGAQIANKLAEQKYAVITGGGPGAMEAGNLGSSQVGGGSIGFNIILPFEQHLNPHTTDSLSFHYFFTRKVMMTFYADAYIYLPGGYGTLDEFFEVITLIQTRKMPYAPVILVGDEFWGDLDKYLRKHLLNSEMISPGDEELYTITEDIDEIVGLINRVCPL